MYVMNRGVISPPPEHQPEPASKKSVAASALAAAVSARESKVARRVVFYGTSVALFCYLMFKIIMRDNDHDGDLDMGDVQRYFDSDNSVNI